MPGRGDERMKAKKAERYERLVDDGRLSEADEMRRDEQEADESAIDEIAEILDEESWSPATLDAIAAVVTKRRDLEHVKED
jgi:hypothetical protein